MPAASNILKNFNAFLAGLGYAGQVKSIQLPALKIKEEEYRAGGMDAPITIDMGMEKMEVSFTLTKYDADALGTFGLAEGQDVPFTFRGALESLDGNVEAVEIDAFGKVNSIEPEEAQAGSASGMKFTIAVRYYRYNQDGVDIHEIDVINMTRLIDGVDQLAAIRSAIGI